MNKLLKKYIFILFFFTTLSSYSTSLKAEIPMGGGKYNTIQIKYAIEGDYQQGEEEFIQKDGKTYRKVSITTKIVANTFAEKTLEIDDGKFFFRINLINKTGIKLPSINKLKKEMVAKNPHLFKNKKNNPFAITPIRGQLNLTQNILDKECQGFVKNNKVYYIWNNIILKEIWEVLGKTTKIAKTLTLDTTIDDTIFTVPEDIKFHL